MSAQISLAHYLTLGALLFLIGMFGALTRRNIIGILMSIELMFNAANINLAAFNHFLYGLITVECSYIFHEFVGNITVNMLTLTQQFF